MPSDQERLLYVAVDTQGNCRPVTGLRGEAVDKISGAIRYLSQLLEDGWQLVSESPDGRSESSIVLLRRSQ